MAEEEGDVRSAGSAERPDIQEGTKDEDLAALVNELATLGLLARDSDNGCEGTEQPPEEAKSDEVYIARSIYSIFLVIIVSLAVRSRRPSSVHHHLLYSQHTSLHLHSEFTNRMVPPP